MLGARKNHYVPQWYQEGFLEPGRNTLAYLDLTPRQRTLGEGRVITERALFDAPTSRAFFQTDLYSTFFGTSVNDEIERRLFGDIDARGSGAVRAFVDTDPSGWHRHFQTLFEYIDIQKIRTPKGLDWLKAQYPQLTQNELMFEMQGIRMMHCTIWTEGVREIVSAEDADVKFIVSDHPITIYNHAVPPNAKACAYPNDPSIALKASQTILPLNKNFCLILTNLEYARDPATSPLEKRTFARNYRSSMVRTDAFIRTRKLTSQEVGQVNYVLKGRARRYIAAGRKEWLYPEKTVYGSWAEFRQTFLPPNDELWNFGGEMYAKFKDGHVHYQDEFGRTEKERDFLKKIPPARGLRPRDPCGCGSGLAFKNCCEPKPTALRPTWAEQSIRERNLMFANSIVNVLELQMETDWVKVRRELTDEKISKIYSLYAALWPLETDSFNCCLSQIGRREQSIQGRSIPRRSPSFGEIMIEHPFLHAGTVKKEFSPVENPSAYRQEFLKAVLLFMHVMPLVERRLVNLIPDPCNFDPHLRHQILHMAKARAAGINVDVEQEPRLKELMEEDFRRTLMSWPHDALKAQVAKVSPELDQGALEKLVEAMQRLKEEEPLAVLHAGEIVRGEKGGHFNVMKLAPNFEMTMYLAQATGASIVTDNRFRWIEITRAARLRVGREAPLSALAGEIGRSLFAFPQGVHYIAALASEEAFKGFPTMMQKVFGYLSQLADRGPKPNVESGITAHFVRLQSQAQELIKKKGIPATYGRMSCVFPPAGIQDHTINRLLLMSSSEKHLPNVPMAFFIQRPRIQSAR